MDPGRRRGDIVPDEKQVRQQGPAGPRSDPRTTAENVKAGTGSYQPLAQRFT